MINSLSPSSSQSLIIYVLLMLTFIWFKSYNAYNGLVCLDSLRGNLLGYIIWLLTSVFLPVFFLPHCFIPLMITILPCFYQFGTKGGHHHFDHVSRSYNINLHQIKILSRSSIQSGEYSSIMSVKTHNGSD